jgi:rhodanese-related sulfurtransferase
MNELQKTQRISIAVLLIGIVLIIGIMVKKAPKNPFSLSAQEMLDNIDGFEHVTSSQAQQMQNDTNQYVFIDLRSPYDFEVQHIENAINIPTAFLLDEENVEALETYKKAEQTVILYGQTERESISPWILLYELGFTNTKVLMGGFDCFLDNNENCPTTMARYDYAKISTQGGIKEVEVIKTKPVVKKKKVIPVKKKVKVEEEGGC